MAKPLPDQFVSGFRGLNNVSDPLRMGLSWLQQADNCNVLDSGALQVRDGYSRTMAGSSISSAYATRDFARMYLVDGTSLKVMAGEAAAVTLASVTAAGAPVMWAEVNGQVFYTNGIESGIIRPDNTVIPWGWTVPAAPTTQAVTGQLDPGLYRACCTFTLPDGRETGAGEASEIELTQGQSLLVSGIPQVSGWRTNVYLSPANSDVFGLARAVASSSLTWAQSPDALGVELDTAFLSPLPLGCGPIAYWRGSMWAARHFPAQDHSALWSSKPLAFHLFDLVDGLVLVPGEVLMLGETVQGLVVGTERAIWLLGPDGLAQLADYGVVPGAHWAPDDGGTILFWSKRGLCRALPFANLTETYLSVAPGARAGGAIVRTDGQKRFLATIQQGGSAFNSFT